MIQNRRGWDGRLMIQNRRGWGSLHESYLMVSKLLENYILTA